MQPLKLVVRFRDGRVLKGTAENFNPLSGGLHLLPAPPSAPTPVSVRFSEVKAVFVVQDYAGKSPQPEKKPAPTQTTIPGTKLRVTFSDGEVMLGHSLNFDPKSVGFFMFPADRSGNNQRVYVINAAVKDIKLVA